MAEEKKNKLRDDMLNDLQKLLAQASEYASINKDYSIQTPLNDFYGTLKNTKTEAEARQVIDFYKYKTKLFDKISNAEYKGQPMFDLDEYQTYRNTMASKDPILPGEVSNEEFQKALAADPKSELSIFWKGNDKDVNKNYWRNWSDAQLKVMAEDMGTTLDDLKSELEARETVYNRKYDPDMKKRLGLDVAGFVAPRTVDEYYETGDWSGKNLAKDIVEDALYAVAGLGAEKAGAKAASAGAKALPSLARTGRKLKPMTKLIGVNAVAPTITSVADYATDPEKSLAETGAEIVSGTSTNIIAPRAFGRLANLAKSGVSGTFAKQAGANAAKELDKLVAAGIPKRVALDFIVNKYGDPNAMRFISAPKEEGGAGLNIMGVGPNPIATAAENVLDVDREKELKKQKKEQEEMEKKRKAGMEKYGYQYLFSLPYVTEE